MTVLGPGTPASRDADSTAVRSLFPGPFCVAFAGSSEKAAPLLPEEAECVRAAVPARQREFALGRWCARRALAELGVSATAIPIGPDRSPCWPTGVVGSITHCRGFTGAVVAAADQVAGIGFDVEPATPLGEDLVSLICTPAETAWARTAPPPHSADWPKVMFCAKEAIHKCIAPGTGVMLEFLTVSVEFDPARGAFAVRPWGVAEQGLPDVARIAGRFAVTSDFVFASACIGPYGS